MARGRTYMIRGASRKQVGDWIDGFLQMYGSFEIRRQLEGDILHITGVSTATKLRTTLRALPQHLSWEVRPITDGVLMRLEERCFRWYRLVIVGICALTSVTFWVGWTFLILSDRWLIFVLGIPSLVLSLLLACLTWYFVSTNGSDDALEHLHAVASREGITVENRSLSESERSSSAFWRFVWFLFGILLIPAAIFAISHEHESLVRVSNWVGLVLTVPLLLILIILILIARRVTKNIGFELRFVTIMAGVSTCIVLLIGLAGQFPLWMMTTVDAEGWYAVFQGRSLLATASPDVTMLAVPAGEVSVEELGGALAFFRVIAIAFLLGPFFFWTFSLFLSTMLFRKLDLVLSHCERLRWNENLSTVRVAVSGRGFLSTFRWLFFPLWAILATMVWVGIAGLVCLALAAVTDFELMRSNSVVSSTARAIEFSIGLPYGNFWSELTARLVLLLWAVGMLAAVIWSIGNLLYRNFRVHRSLRELTEDDYRARDGTALSAIVADLATRVGRAAPKVCVRDSSMPHACAHEFGLFRRIQYIEVSSICFEILNSDELGAVLAHEWSHHFRHHCSTHRLMHVLGRLTFVGGAFVGALENSYAYEHDADENAILKFNIQPDLLKRSLLRMRAVATTQRLLSAMNPQGLELLPHRPPKGNKNQSRLWGILRIKHMLKTWLLFYTADNGVSYWHPSIDDRVRALSELG